MDFEWEPEHRAFIGELREFIREGLRQAKTGAGNFMQSGAEYVTEEARVVISKSELDDFNTQVDKIRQRGDRLQARVNELLKGGS